MIHGGIEKNRVLAPASSGLTRPMRGIPANTSIDRCIRANRVRTLFAVAGRNEVFEIANVCAGALRISDLRCGHGRLFLRLGAAFFPSRLDCRHHFIPSVAFAARLFGI